MPAMIAKLQITEREPLSWTLEEALVKFEFRSPWRHTYQ